VAPLDIETPTSNTGEASDNRLYHVAPVLRGGWVLIGEQSKCATPQRETALIRDRDGPAVADPVALFAAVPPSPPSRASFVRDRYVAVSPQRIMAAAHGRNKGASNDAVTEDELLLPSPPDATTSTTATIGAATTSEGSGRSTTLAFTVLGEPGEQVEIAVVVPPQPAAGVTVVGGVLHGKVRVVRVEVGPSGRSAVKCSATSDGCQVVL
jgi:hypothetical protein